MRVIKFRAWDKAGRKMLYGWNLACDDKGVFETGWFGGLDGLDPETEDDLWDEYNHTTIELMQYTGLKDKNGKEIYDLHILNNKFIVVFYQYIVYIVDISNGDILKKGLKHDELEITGEYFSLPEDSKRSVDKYIRQAESAFKNQEICFTVV